MNAFFSAGIFLSMTLFLVLTGCANNSTKDSGLKGIMADTILSTNKPAGSANNAGKQQDALTEMYARAIGDYIQLVKENYQLRFDTLFFGKHVNGQDTDFPDIALPAMIENTGIKVISPEQGEVHQRKNPSSFYINLFGTVNENDAGFIFVTFSNGFAHQFDCFIDYTYDKDKKTFVIKTSRFENYSYKRRG